MACIAIELVQTFHNARKICPEKLREGDSVFLGHFVLKWINNTRQHGTAQQFEPVIRHSISVKIKTHLCANQ